MRIIAAEFGEEDRHLLRRRQHQLAPLIWWTTGLARQLVGVANIVHVEGAVRDIAVERSREIPILIQRHHKTLIIEAVVHAPTIQVEPFAPEPVLTAGPLCDWYGSSASTLPSVIILSPIQQSRGARRTASSPTYTPVACTMPGSLPRSRTAFAVGIELLGTSMIVPGGGRM